MDIIICVCVCVHLSTGKVQSQCVQDLLQVSLQQIATMALVKVDKCHQQLLVVCDHLLLLLVQQQTMFTLYHSLNNKPKIKNK